MTSPHFFIEPPMVSGGRIILENEVRRHIAAQRLSPGDRFTAVCDDMLYDAEVQEIKKRRVTASILAQNKIVQPQHKVHLYPALLKGDKFDLVVEKCTELGVTSIAPVITRRTIPKLYANKEINKIRRWKKVARSACEQCKRLTLPDIRDILSFPDLMQREFSGCLLLAYECLEQTFTFPESLSVHNEVSVLVGPEGGFDNSEVEAAKNKGFIPVSLNPNILRAETASIVAVGLIIHYLTQKA